ncbi:MAG: ABC transporter permease [Clostridia bacterium]|nr:ABC transporter permease [Clostridia bacterium]MBR4458612.1 ABC transporter permease [Clostridia bacterium]
MRYEDLPASVFGPAEKRDDTEQIARPSLTYWHDVWRRFRKNKLAMIGLGFILIMTIACILVPMLSVYSYDGMDYTSMNAAPSWKHLCGADFMGRDLFIRIMYGARISLTIGLVAAAINMVIGVTVGGVSGYCGGYTDIVIMRIVDILSSLPSLLYILLIMLLLGKSLTSVIIALCFTSWTGTARVVRNEVLRLKQSEYVLAARLAGARTPHLLLRHLVPNAMGPIIVSTAFMIPNAIFSEAFLAFLGIGIELPKASWGTLANGGIKDMASYPHLVIFPIIAICLTMFSFNFIGDGLRDALDPRLKH